MHLSEPITDKIKIKEAGELLSVYFKRLKNSLAKDFLETTTFVSATGCMLKEEMPSIK